MAETTTPATSSEHEARAFDLMVKMRELARTIQGFNFAGKGRRVQIANFANLPEEFFELMAVACDTYPEVAAAAQLTGAEIRSVITASRAYKAVANDMVTQARGLDDTVAEYRGDIGRRTLNAYEIAKRLEKQIGPIPHLPAIRRALNKGRPKKDKQEDGAAAAAKKEK
jgi:hypothetical protein